MNRLPSDNESCFDLAIIGSGISGAYTLHNLLLELPSNSEICPRIAVLERSAAFEGGIAYGRRSGSRALTITGLNDFLPEYELISFLRWLRENRRNEYDALRATAGVSEASQDTDSIVSDRELLDAVGHVCAPRKLFGEYVSHMLREGIKKAVDERRAKVEIFQFDVEKIDKSESGLFHLYGRADPDSVESAVCAAVAKQVVLAIGSPPKLSLLNPGQVAFDILKSDPCFIDAPYADDVELALERAFEAVVELRKVGSDRPVRFVIAGSNASSSELIVAIERLCRQYRLPFLIDVVSETGELPEQYTEENSVEDKNAIAGLVAESFDRLLEEGCTAEKLSEVAKDALFQGRARNLSLQSYSLFVNDGIFNCLSRMIMSEKLLFLQRYGNQLGRWQRRMEKEYSVVIDKMIKLELLRISSGRVKEITQENGIFRIKLDVDGQHYTKNADCIINCIGAEAVNETSSSYLIAQLVSDGLAKKHAGTSGFEVDEAFMTEAGIYIMGPLLAGNIVDQKPIWHMEHAGRILAFSKILARRLAGEIDARRCSDDVS